MTTETLDLVRMAHIAIDAGTIKGSPATMTADEIVTAYVLALLMLAAFEGGAQ